MIKLLPTFGTQAFWQMGGIKKVTFLWLRAAVVLLGITLVSWGKFGHEHINNAAVMELPAPMQQFFYNHIDYLTVEANLPDTRKYILKDSAEYPRHHIHLQTFGNLDSIPKASKQAYARYSKSFLLKHGCLPWYVQDMMVKLTDAFKHQHKSEILFLAADLGHYIGDAHMPLHTSNNHDGMATNHKGIHALFESHLPELFGEGYNYNTGHARYISDVQAEIWRIIIASNHAADTLLKADRDLTAAYPADNIFEKAASGSIRMSIYGEPYHTTAYSKAYHQKLNGMVERQIRGAIATTANFWYTAWVNAGKPNLNNLDAPQVTRRNASAMARDKLLFKRGKLFGIKSEREY